MFLQRCGLLGFWRNVSQRDISEDVLDELKVLWDGRRDHEGELGSHGVEGRSQRPRFLFRPWANNLDAGNTTITCWTRACFPISGAS